MKKEKCLMVNGDVTNDVFSKSNVCACALGCLSAKVHSVL